MKKYALVTGSSRGIGKAIALSLAQKGYHLFINSSKSRKDLETLGAEITEFGGCCTLLPGDVGDPQQVEIMFKSIREITDTLDVLVNNAGISKVGLLQDLDLHDWDALIATNLSSVFYCSKLAVPMMLTQKKGKIINISSIWGIAGASCEVAYATTKGGINSFTKALAKELAPSNIQVNAIACGVIETDMNNIFDLEEKESIRNEIPAGRFGTPKEVAELVTDLTENHPYLTGQVIALDGGMIS